MQCSDGGTPCPSPPGWRWWPGWGRWPAPPGRSTSSTASWRWPLEFYLLEVLDGVELPHARGGGDGEQEVAGLGVERSSCCRIISEYSRVFVSDNN